MNDVLNFKYIFQKSCLKLINSLRQYFLSHPFLSPGHIFFTHHVQILLTFPSLNPCHNKGLNAMSSLAFEWGDLVECTLPFLYHMESITSMTFHRLIIVYSRVSRHKLDINGLICSYAEYNFLLFLFVCLFFPLA